MKKLLLAGCVTFLVACAPTREQHALIETAARSDEVDLTACDGEQAYLRVSIGDRVMSSSDAELEFSAYSAPHSRVDGQGFSFRLDLGNDELLQDGSRRASFQYRQMIADGPFGEPSTEQHFVTQTVYPLDWNCASRREPSVVLFDEVVLATTTDETTMVRGSYSRSGACEESVVRASDTEPRTIATTFSVEFCLAGQLLE